RQSALAFNADFIDAIVEYDKSGSMICLQQLQEQDQILMRRIPEVRVIFRMHPCGCSKQRWDCLGVRCSDSPHCRSAKKICLTFAGLTPIDGLSLRVGPPPSMTFRPLYCTRPPADEATVLGSGRTLLSSDCSGNRVDDRDAPIQNVGQHKENEQIVRNEVKRRSYG